MAALITELIDKQDNNEIVLAQIVAILALERDNQKALAITAGKDPALWDFALFQDRAKPWDVFADLDGNEEGDVAPGLVNCYFTSDSFDNPGSNVIKEQKARGTFNLDCYGYKNSISDPITGKVTEYGDELSSKEVDRVSRLVRNILMSGPYTYLFLGRSAFPDNVDLQIVSKRYIIRREKFFPPSSQNGEFNVIGERLTINVDYRELGPQAQMEELLTLISQCKRGDSGEIYFTYEES